MIELYVIKSMHSSAPLAEIRTDSKNIDWILDNTNGKLAQSCGGDFAKLKSIIDKSSHMSMETPTEATVGMLRYSLENGDIVEISTDGKTALLNGKIMPEEEKVGLMSAISSGKIKVKNKANLEKPMQVFPKRKAYKVPEKPQTIKKESLEAIQKHLDAKKSKDELNDRNHDSEINAVDFSGDEYPERGKQLLYLLKYGDK